MKHLDYEIVIVGGGLVGLAFACSLRGLDHRVLVIDAGQPPVYDEHGAYDLRVNSINIASQTFLDAMGIWKQVAKKRIEAFHTIKVWDSVGGHIEFSAQDIDEPYLGHIVESSLLTSSLAQALQAADNIDIRYGIQIEAMNVATDGVELKMHDGLKLQAALAIGADGANSAVRQMSGIFCSKRVYSQTAYVAQIEVEHPRIGISYQKFLDSGPLALLPLSDQSYSIVWSCDASLADELNQVDDDEFSQRLAQVLDYRFGEVKLVSQRVSFYLNKLLADQYYRGRCVLIGDAAHVVHPLAGMGANLGLMDAAALGEVVSKISDFTQQAQYHSQLRLYERWRKSENVFAANLIDGFDRGFRNPAPTMRSMLGLGMSVTNRFGVVKNEMMRFACGLTGDLPRIAMRAN